MLSALESAPRAAEWQVPHLARGADSALSARLSAIAGVTATATATSRRVKRVAIARGRARAR